VAFCDITLCRARKEREKENGNKKREKKERKIYSKEIDRKENSEMFYSI